jgi:hypothetical protein
LLPLRKPVQPVSTIKPGVFTNGGTAITDGHATVLGAAVALRAASLSHWRRYQDRGI